MNNIKLKELLPSQFDGLTSELVLQAVAQQYGITIDDLTSRKRYPQLVAARHSACWLLKNLLRYKLQPIADTLKMKNHTSVIHALESIENLFDVNDELVVKNITPIIHSLTNQQNNAA